jgi:hypothetical protein
MTEVWRSETCPDCSVAVGEKHDHGRCDVERCKRCGWQALGCAHVEDTPATTWTGTWPGEIEVSEGLADDLNDLARKHVRGDLVWDRDKERLVRSDG